MSTAASEPSFAVKLYRSLRRQFQLALDNSVPLLAARWVALGVTFILYAIRVYLLQGFYIVTYGLGIFLLNLLIGFISPIDESDTSQSSSDGPLLPTNENDEFKPFIRRLPEFKFWYSCIRAIVIALALTTVDLFDVPVFWPILLVYFIVLFVMTMKRQIRHMMKHKYLPFKLGKKTYKGGKASAASDVRTR